MHYVATCPFCEQGLVGVRVCCRNQQPLLVCDECEAIWYEPTCQGKPVFPRGEDSPCPRCGKPVWKHPARWGTRRDVAKSGWLKHVAGQVRKPSGS